MISCFTVQNTLFDSMKLDMLSYGKTSFQAELSDQAGSSVTQVWLGSSYERYPGRPLMSDQELELSALG